MFVMLGMTFFILIPNYTKDCRSIFFKNLANLQIYYTCENEI